MKPTIFHPAARAVIKKFSKEVRIKFGKAITALQYGAELTMPLSKPMGSIRSGAEELRVKDSDGTYRVIYFIPGEAVWIVHAFVKKTEKTPLREIKLAKKRLKEMEDE